MFGRHINHPRVRGLLQKGDEGLGEDAGAEDVGLEGEAEVLEGGAGMMDNYAGVLDQDVEAGEGELQVGFGGFDG